MDNKSINVSLPNPSFHQIIKPPNNLLAGTYRPYVIAVAGLKLNAEAHVAIPHTDAPRVVRVAGAGSRRPGPVVVGLHIVKTLCIKPWGCIRLSGIIYQASKLINIGKKPVRITEVAVGIQAGYISQRDLPCFWNTQQGRGHYHPLSKQAL